MANYIFYIYAYYIHYLPITWIEYINMELEQFYIYLKAICPIHPNMLLELDITLALHERGLPWHVTLMVRQLFIEFTMCRTVELHSLKLALRSALIGIKESNEQDTLE